MKKNRLTYVALFALAGASFLATSCKDADEVQDITLSQVLSVTNLSMSANADLSIDIAWDQMFNATSYELVVSQDANFADASQTVYSNTIAEAYQMGGSCKVNVKGLDPETEYYGRLKSLGNAADSKYIYGKVTTVAEQIMAPVKKADVTANGVTVNWTPGEQIKAVEVIDASGNVLQTLTPSAADITAGSLAIAGLTPHTSYTVRLVSLTDKTRGRRTFTTLLDLSGATTITAAQGADGSWVAIVEGAAAGAVFALEDGDYVLSGTSTSVKITNGVVIAAKDITKMPTLHTTFQIDNNASLYCYYVKIDAANAQNSEGNQCFVYKSSGDTGSLDVEGCELYGNTSTKGMVYIASTVTTVINEVNIIDSYIHDIICTGGDFLDSRKGGWTTLNFKNNTVVNCFKNRAFVRSDAFACTSNIENNTIYNCGIDENGDSYAIFTNKDAGAISNFNNNVVEGYVQKRGFNGGRATATVTTDNNVYFKCLNLTELDPENTSSNKPTFFDEKGMVLSASPFKDAANGDFRLVDPNLRLKQVGAAIWYEQSVDE